ncbi:hypothetical protein LTR66_005563 [Elasticomyces elasticus]|nr:hypothetical protein LTR66_005563 [Elasticomyces elasticus]
MINTRVIARSSRTALRSTRPLRRANARFQSTQSNPPSQTGPAVIGGLIGGLTVFGIGYGYYYFSGAKTVVNYSQQAKAYFNQTSQKVKESIPEAPEPSEALKWLRQTANSYAVFIPGASSLINKAFDDVDAIHRKHGQEVDDIVKNAYGEIKEITKKGLNLDTAQEAWQALQKYGQQIAELAGDAAEDILNNHPQLKEKVGGRIDQLKSMGEQYGPEAKKQVEETWSQITDVMKGGFSAQNMEKARKLIEEKVEQVKKMGDEAWKKGMEQAKPYLDKNPKIKELVEKNADALKQGNAMELFQNIKDSVQSGSTEDLEKYVNGAVDKAKKSAGGMMSGGGGLEQLLKMIPGGDQIAPKLSHLQEVAQKHRKEGESILKETIDEIQKVLSKQSEKAKKLAESAKEDSK